MNFNCDILIPDPPKGKIGWPWESVQDFSNNTTFTNDFPLISIITPSFNQGDYIEETIRSIILQGYPRLQYIIVDGGSTDSTLNVINKYTHLIDIVISEPDKGQSDAINKGWNLAVGQISTWINSDDYLAPGVLFEVAKMYINSPSIIVGDVINFYGNNSKKHKICQSNINVNSLLRFWSNDASWHQPGIFFPMDILKEIGYLDTKYHFAMDFDLLCKVVPLKGLIYSDKIFTYFRLHESSKGVGFPISTVLEKIEIYHNFKSLMSELTWIDHMKFGIWYLKFSLKLLSGFHFGDLIKFNKALIIE